MLVLKVVSERLGHANIGITLKLYSHVSEGMTCSTADLVAGCPRELFVRADRGRGPVERLGPERTDVADEAR